MVCYTLQINVCSFNIQMNLKRSKSKCDFSIKHGKLIIQSNAHNFEVQVYRSPHYQIENTVGLLAMNIETFQNFIQYFFKLNIVSFGCPIKSSWNFAKLKIRKNIQTQKNLKKIIKRRINY